MPTPVIMPKQGQSVETCIITRWYRSKGDKISAGDLLFSYETDKAAFEMESPVDGILLETFFDEGAEVPVLANVALIGEPGAISSGDGKIRISPRARLLAKEKRIDYSALPGSGPNNRIIISDIEKADSATVPAKKAFAAAGDFTDHPLTNVRRMIAKAMHSSLQNSAQLTHHMSADVRRLLEVRRRVKEGVASGNIKQDITLNDMICWCVIRALEKYPEANSHFPGESLRTFSKVHLGIAVDTPRGLMVPAVKNAGNMDLVQLSKELKSVADSCRKGNINPELLHSTAASFTVSNLGNYGVEMFTPVINLPQVAILGVCTIAYRPADLGNNTFGFVPYIGLSLTYDHRAIDGGPVTMFLKEIKNQIENFSYINL